MAREQDQFLEVVNRDTAERRWWEWLRPEVLEPEQVALASALGRVLASDVIAEVNVPPFDRSNVNGYAVQAQDTFGAGEESTASFGSMTRRSRPAGHLGTSVEPGTATSIATGGVVPRGADAVVMVEHAYVTGDTLQVVRPVAPGAAITFAGTDIARGERILRRGVELSARETGILAALGNGSVQVVRRPKVGIISTGDELIAPGDPERPAAIYDANSTLLADARPRTGCRSRSAWASWPIGNRLWSWPSSRAWPRATCSS